VKKLWALGLALALVLSGCAGLSEPSFSVDPKLVKDCQFDRARPTACFGELWFKVKWHFDEMKL
jgi:hypothetical protein